MLALLGTIFGSIFSGGATGLLGVLFQRYADYKNRQLDITVEAQKQANAIALRRVDAEIMQQEWAARLQVTQTEVDGRTEVADAAAFAKSMEMEPQRYATGDNFTAGQRWVMVGLDALRGSIRPVLTLYLCILVTVIYNQAAGLLKSDMTAEQALELVNLVVGTVLYLTTTCVLWWFGTRNSGSKSATKKQMKETH